MVNMARRTDENAFRRGSGTPSGHAHWLLCHRRPQRLPHQDAAFAGVKAADGESNDFWAITRRREIMRYRRWVSA